MDAKCAECGKKLPVNTALLKNVVGGSLITGAAVGWTSYAFAGLLGFYGGAALIAIALLAGGGAVLASKDSAAVAKVGTKITDILNTHEFPCSNCGAVNWIFAGVKGNDLVSGLEHKEVLEKALQNVRHELIIASGFLSYYVVNESFVRKLRSTLARHVKITLVFSDSRSHSDWQLNGFNAALKLLESVSHEYPNLKLIQKHTHQKGIVVDDQYAVIGSFNFLSNNRVERAETSSKVSDEASIKGLKNEFLSFKS